MCIVWLENHAIYKIADGQDHAYPLGDPKCRLEFSTFPRAPTTCLLLEYHLVHPTICSVKLTRYLIQFFALTSSSSRSSTMGPKTFALPKKHQWRWWWSCLWWCFSCFSALCILWASWCSYRAYTPSPRVAASAACTSMWCLWACAGSTFSWCFSYCCKK